MYSLSKDLDNAIDVLSYTISAMVDSGYMPCDINEFLTQATGKGNYNLLIKSLDMLEECNKVIKDDLSYEDTWRDYYYNGEDYMLDYNDEDKEIEYIPYDEDEAYEGFDSCKKHVYNSNEDDEESYDYCPFE